jgi:hypothetical protein
MNRSKSTFMIIMIFAALAVPYSPLHAGSREGDRKAAASAGGHAGQAWAFVAMAEPGHKVQVGNDNYLIFGFDKKPKMGTVIMKIQAYNNRGEKDTSLAITADSWMPSMPSMRGGHSVFMLSKKGEYLTPVDITMPGDWEIKLTIVKDGKVIFRGSHKFDV